MKRRVSFPNNSHLVSGVHALPLTNRGYEPGYLERRDRLRALRFHGIQVNPLALNDDFGTESRRGRFLERVDGRLGTYTHTMARRDIWHAQKFGTPWYRIRRTGGKIAFVSRNPASDASKIAQMAGDA